MECLKECIAKHDIDTFRKKLPASIKNDKSYSSLLFNTVRADFPEGMQLLLDHGASVNIGDRRQNSPPLTEAVRKNKLHLVKILLSHKKVDPNILGCNLGEAPLHYAIMEDLSILKMLLQHKNIQVDVEIGYDSGETPLWKAIHSNNLEACTLLLEKKANPNKKLNGKILPLHYAIVESKYKMIQLLLKYNADPNKKCDKYVSEECSNIYWKKYKNTYGFHAQRKKELGSTALQLATQKGYDSEIIDLLLHCGADPNVQNFSDRAALFNSVVIDNNNVELTLAVIKKLILAGADLKIKRRFALDEGSQIMTPYDVAVHLGKLEVAQLLANSEEFLRGEAYKKFGTSIFKGTMLRGMGMSSQVIKNLSRVDKK